MSDTILVAIITAIATTIPNIIIAIIKNKQELKLKKFETLELAKRQAIIDYLDSLGECFTSDGGILIQQAQKYQKSANRLIFYFPNLDIDLIESARNSIQTCKSEEKIEAVMPLIKELSKSIKDK